MSVRVSAHARQSTESQRTYVGRATFFPTVSSFSLFLPVGWPLLGAPLRPCHYTHTKSSVTAHTNTRTCTPPFSHCSRPLPPEPPPTHGRISSQAGHRGLAEAPTQASSSGTSRQSWRPSRQAGTFTEWEESNPVRCSLSPHTAPHVSL